MYWLFLRMEYIQDIKVSISTMNSLFLRPIKFVRKSGSFEFIKLALNIFRSIAFIHISTISAVKSTGYLFSKHTRSFVGLQNNCLSADSAPTLFTIKSNKKDPSKMSIYGRFSDSCVPIKHGKDSNQFDIEMNKHGDIRIKKNDNCEAVHHGYLKKEPCKDDEIRQKFIWIPKPLFMIQNDIPKNFSNQPSPYENRKSKKRNKKRNHSKSSRRKRDCDSDENLCVDEECSSRNHKPSKRRKRSSSLDDRISSDDDSLAHRNYNKKNRPIESNHDQIDSNIQKPTPQSDQNINDRIFDDYLKSYCELSKISEMCPTFKDLVNHFKNKLINGKKMNVHKESLKPPSNLIPVNDTSPINDPIQNGNVESNNSNVIVPVKPIALKPVNNTEVLKTLLKGQPKIFDDSTYNNLSQILNKTKLSDTSIPYNKQERPRGVFARGFDPPADCSCMNDCVRNPKNNKCFYKMDTNGKLTPIMKNRDCCNIQNRSLCDLSNILDKYICELTFMNDYSYFSNFIDDGYSYNS